MWLRTSGPANAAALASVQYVQPQFPTSTCQCGMERGMWTDGTGNQGCPELCPFLVPCLLHAKLSLSNGWADKRSRAATSALISSAKICERQAKTRIHMCTRNRRQHQATLWTLGASGKPQTQQDNSRPNSRVMARGSPGAPSAKWRALVHPTFHCPVRSLKQCDG